MIKTPINFASFATSLVDIQRAAQLSGIYLNDATVAAWQLTFNSDGTVNVKTCTGTNQTSSTPPTCTQFAGVSQGGADERRDLRRAERDHRRRDLELHRPGRPGYIAPRNLTNAVCVNGRVTVASNNQIVIGDDIGYVTSAGGDDVLGLIARGDMIVAQWAPSTLNWRAATIAQTGQWSSASSDGSHTHDDVHGLDRDRTGRPDVDVPDAELQLRRLAAVPAAALVPDDRLRVHGAALPRAARPRSDRATAHSSSPTQASVGPCR